MHLAKSDVLLIANLVQVLAIIIIFADFLQLIHFCCLVVRVRLRCLVLLGVECAVICSLVCILVDDEKITLLCDLVFNLLELAEEFEEVAVDLLLVDVFEVFVVLDIDHLVRLNQLHSWQT